MVALDGLGIVQLATLRPLELAMRKAGVVVAVLLIVSGSGFIVAQEPAVPVAPSPLVEVFEIGRAVGKTEAAIADIDAALKREGAPRTERAQRRQANWTRDRAVFVRRIRTIEAQLATPAPALARVRHESDALAEDVDRVLALLPDPQAQPATAAFPVPPAPADIIGTVQQLRKAADGHNEALKKMRQREAQKRP